MLRAPVYINIHPPISVLVTSQHKRTQFEEVGKVISIQSKSKNACCLNQSYSVEFFSSILYSMPLQSVNLLAHFI